MKYAQIQSYTDSQFKRLIGVDQVTFADMVSIPNTHQSVGQQIGMTNSVERFNATARHLGRLTRKTLSFSKTKEEHEACAACLHRAIQSRGQAKIRTTSDLDTTFELVVIKLDVSKTLLAL